MPEPDFDVPAFLSPTNVADVDKAWLQKLAAALRDRGIEGVPKGIADMTAAAGEPLVPDPSTGYLSVTADITMRDRAVAGGRLAVRATETASSATIDASNYLDYLGRLTPYGSASPGTRTISGAIPSGAMFTFIQVGAGALQISAAGGLTLRHVSGHTRTAGQWAPPITALVIGNDVILMGATAP